MSELLDPEHKNRELDAEMQKTLYRLNNEYSQKEADVNSAVEKRISSFQSQINDKNKIRVGDRVFTGFIVGAIVGLFMCIPGSNDMGSKFLIWILCIGAGGLLFGAISEVSKATSGLEAQIKAAEKDREEKLANLRADREEELTRIRTRFEAEKSEHLEKFSKLQREVSQKYVGSAVAQEITDFILAPFKKTIEASDRRPHIKHIKVPLSFEVYRHKVESPYGTYDFTIKRVQALDDMSNVAALANAIATAVHADVIASYPLDPSGGEVTPMEIEYEYKQDSVKAAMTYLAENAHFVEARSF